MTHSRFGFIVPKTIDKRAVVRNEIRRLFQACVGSMIEKIKPGYDMLFIMGREIKKIDREHIYDDIHTLLMQYV